MINLDKSPATRKQLPAFRVFYTNGESYVTSMAAGVTLSDAQAYFVGQVHTSYDETETRTVKEVAQIRTVTVERGAGIPAGVYEEREYGHAVAYMRLA